MDVKKVPGVWGMKSYRSFYGDEIINHDIRIPSLKNQDSTLSIQTPPKSRIDGLIMFNPIPTTGL